MKALALVMLLAAKAGHCQFIETLVRRGVPLDSPFLYNGRSPLQYAIQHGKVDAVKLLLNLGADYLALDQDGANMLHVAVKGCECENTPDLNPCPHAIVMQAYQAHITSKEKTFQDIINATKPQKMLLIQSFKIKNMSLFELYLKNGVKYSIINRDKETTLHIACEMGKLKAVKDLVEAGASLTVKDVFGYTPFHNAVQFSQVDVVSYLITKGVDLNQGVLRLKRHTKFLEKHFMLKDTEGFKPIQIAILMKNRDILRMLASNQDVDCAVRTSEKNLGLMGLAREVESHEDLLREIYRIIGPVAGDINTKFGKNHHRHILHSILRSVDVDTYGVDLLKALCDNPAIEIDVLNSHGKTRLQAYIESGHFHYKPHYLQVLVERGACPNVSINEGQITPLIWSMLYGDNDLMRAMLHAGAHPDLRGQLANFHFANGIGNVPEETINSAFTLALAMHDSGTPKLRMLLAVDCDISEYIENPNLVSEYQNEVKHELLSNRASQVLMLKQGARKTIRNHLKCSKFIEDLKLPRIIKDYLYVPELREVNLRASDPHE